MSDGPHRSLPLGKHWKNLAERADKAAYSASDVSEALPVALRREFRDAPFKQLKAALGVGDQAGLFVAERPEQLDALRYACAGSAAGNALIDCAKEALADGLTGESACQRAAENALEECVRANFRSIEEHYYRQAPAHNARYVRGRMEEARHGCDFSSLAGNLLEGSGKRGSSGRLIRHEGIDAGPEL